MIARIGLISDTHNLLRPHAMQALRGCEHLIHAGDICAPRVLADLAALAPVTAVRGNNDRGDWADGLAEQETIAIAGVTLLVIHDLKDLRAVPAGTRVVVSGHSHRPKIEGREGVLYVNPGSAGPRRFKLPVTVAELTIDRGAVTARIVDLPL